MDSLSSFLSYLRIERNASVHTKEAYGRDIRQFLGFLAESLQKPLDQLDEQDLEQTPSITLRMWLHALLEQGLKKTTIARKASSLKSFFAYLQKRDYIDRNPTEALLLPKKEKRLPVVISDEEMAQCLDALNDLPGDSFEAMQERAILEVLYSTGMRLSELIGLNIADFNVQQRQVKVLGKGNKERVLPLGGKAQLALNDMLRARGQKGWSSTPLDPLFVTIKGARVYPRMIQRLVKDYLDRVSEATKKSPHVIRHSFATRMLDRGADIRIIKEFLGHASLSATQIYTHTSVEHLKSIHAKAHPRGGSKVNANPQESSENDLSKVPVNPSSIHAGH
ncbi:MAG: tyrosine recombinase XerC [Rhodothermaeota bacterium MED-G64]|nr:MAG: tyrosine recombinase XerC [Rhodothermaeota bacterium MED-G64]RPF79816.1 MAG: tyrosine recombinase XerC [Rhodothermaceae bacterium TMED105]|tara:strand:- start:8366 stop:9373 length:1008 start_codon:yes stop_codon:yes gene_type:complete